jgi:hypothetical protein
VNGEERFGHSLALVDGDLVLDTAGTGRRELRVVEGLRNLLQALELRILTPFGSDLFNTTYGLDVKEVFTRPGGLRTVKELLRLNLVRTLGTDPRVREIRDVLFEDDPAYLARHPELDPKKVREHRHRRAWQVEVIIATVASDEEVLSVRLGV